MLRIQNMKKSYIHHYYLVRYDLTPPDFVALWERILLRNSLNSNGTSLNSEGFPMISEENPFYFLKARL